MVVLNIVLFVGAGINLSFDGNVSAQTTTNNVVAEVYITENTQLTSSNSNNVDVFLCKGNAANAEQ